MSDVIMDRWRGDADIMDLTAKDLEEGRSQYTRVSDSSRELHLLLELLQRRLGLENWSQAADIALRIELAHAIDNYQIDFSREDYEIAYMIPPVGYVDELLDSSTELLILEDSDVEPQQWKDFLPLDESDIDDDHRTIGFSTTETVHTMAKDAVEREAYETVSEIVKTGVKRLLGHLE